MKNKIFLTIIIFFVFIVKSFGAYFPFNVNVGSSNVGIGTSLAGGGFVVMNGNVGVGTWIPSQLFEATGTIKAVTFSGDGSVITNVPSGGWSTLASNNYTSLSTYNVGLGTTTPVGKLIVMNGNVGIGTWTADGGKLIIQSGNVGLGTWVAAGLVDVASGFQRIISTGSGNDNLILAESAYPTSNRWKFRVVDQGTSTDLNLYASDSADADTLIASMAPFNSNRASLYINGNVGLGTNLPVSKLAVIGGVGIGTGISSSFVGVTVASGSMIVHQNVGIGTISPQGALVVMNGNMGIGTWNAPDTLYVAGNVGVGVASSYQLYPAPSNGVMIQGNIGIGTFGPSTMNLEVWNGATFSRMNAGDTQFVNASSRAYKEHIKPFRVDHLLDRMDKVKVMTYDYRSDYCQDKKACQNRLGLIAEDFYEVFGRGSPEEINGNDVQMALWISIGELKNELDQLQKKYQLLTVENDLLRQRIKYKSR